MLMQNAQSVTNSTAIAGIVLTSANDGLWIVIPRSPFGDVGSWDPENGGMLKIHNIGQSPAFPQRIFSALNPPSSMVSPCIDCASATSWVENSRQGNARDDTLADSRMAHPLGVISSPIPSLSSTSIPRSIKSWKWPSQTICIFHSLPRQNREHTGAPWLSERC